MKVYIGSDHAGFALKEKLKVFLSVKGYQVADCGAYSFAKGDDYPFYAFRVAEKTVSDRESKGILICGSGAGVSIAANKVRGARAVLATDVFEAVDSRKDDNTNILCLRARKSSFESAKKVALAWLRTEFRDKLPYTRRIKEISAYE